MTINIANNDPRVSYTVGQGVTQTSFTVPFEFFANGDLNVYVDSVLKTITTHYTVSGGDGSTGTITMSVTGASGGSTVIITRDIDLERTTDFPSSGPFNIASLNTDLDRFVAISADLKDQADRSLRLDDSDAAISMVLPNAASRADKLLAFDSTGAISMGTSGSLDLSLDTVSVNNINAPADLNIKPTGGQVNIVGTSDQDRIRFNNDATPSMDVFGAFTIDGNNTFDLNCGGTFTLDSGGDINLDGNGGDVRFKDNGVTKFTFRMTSTPRILSHSGGLLIEADTSGDIDLDPFGVVNILATGGGSPRFTFNNDTTPTFEIIPASGGKGTFELGTLGANQTYTFPNATGTVALQSYVTQNSINNLSEDSTPELGGNLDLLTHSIVSSSNRDIVLAPDGTGNVKINDEKLEFTGATTGNAHQTTIVVTDPTADRTITIPDSSGTIMFSSGGSITGDTTFSDNIKAIFGAGSDLTIEHDTTNSVISNDTNELIIESDALTLRSTTSSEKYLEADKDGSVDLYYDNTKTFETVSGGAKTTGTHNITGDLTVGATNSEALFVDVSSEFVGINTITPRSNLHIHEPDSATTSQIQFTNDTTGQANNDVGLKIGIGGLENAFIHNVSNTDLTLSTNDTTWIRLDVSASKIDASYYIEAPYFEATSDVNLKENITKIDSAISKVQAISGYTYNFKDNPEIQRAGLIAQDVEKILPESVSTNKNNKKTLDYNGTIALLVEAVKEQQEEINILKNKIN